MGEGRPAVLAEDGRDGRGLVGRVVHQDHVLLFGLRIAPVADEEPGCGEVSCGDLAGKVFLDHPVAVQGPLR